MAKKSVVKYECSNCGAIAATWSGRCHVCGEWNTMQEQLVVEASTIAKRGQKLRPQSITSVAKADKIKRLTTAISEVDTVLRGGFVAGSITLIAGEPGFGKSTLLLQLA